LYNAASREIGGKESKIMRGYLTAALAVAVPLVAIAQTQTPPSAGQAELEKLQLERTQRMQAASKELNDALQKSKTGEVSQEQMAKLQEGYAKVYTDLWPRYEALVKSSKGGIQVRARLDMIQLAQLGRQYDKIEAIASAIVKENVDIAETAQSVPVLSRLGMTLGGGMGAKNAQEQQAAIARGKVKVDGYLAALEKSKNPAVRAGVLYYQAQGERDSQKKSALFAQLLEKYPTTDYGKMAQAARFEAENLQIGKAAPNFTATDENGKTFTLADYKGKVVVLDFWGFW
jgi:hypothetical protein